MTIEDVKKVFVDKFMEINSTLPTKRKTAPTPEEWVNMFKDFPELTGAVIEVHNNAIKSVTEDTTNLI